MDKTEELIRALAVQQKLTLIACYAGLSWGKRGASAGQVYEVHRELCQRRQLKPLTQRPVPDMIVSLDLCGPVNAPVISRRRYGQKREIAASLPLEVVDRLLRRNFS